MIPSESPD